MTEDVKKLELELRLLARAGSLELSQAEKIDLFAFSYTETAKTLFKLMQFIILDSRDAAMAIDPTDTKGQTVAMTIAHAQRDFYMKVVELMQRNASEHKDELQKRANAELLEDRDEIESIILNQAINPLSSPRPEASIL